MTCVASEVDSNDGVFGRCMSGILVPDRGVLVVEGAGGGAENSRMGDLGTETSALSWV